MGGRAGSRRALNRLFVPAIVGMIVVATLCVAGATGTERDTRFDPRDIEPQSGFQFDHRVRRTRMLGVAEWGTATFA